MRRIANVEEIAIFYDVQYSSVGQFLWTKRDNMAYESCRMLE